MTLFFRLPEITGLWLDMIVIIIVDVGRRT